MGIYDRDYYRPERQGLQLRWPQSMVGLLILANVVLWLLDWVSTQHAFGGLLGGRSLHDLLGAYGYSLRNPLYSWQLLTYGFMHSIRPEHIVFNMLGLWFLGRDVEGVYGKREFLRLYLALIVFGGIIWSGWNLLRGAGDAGPLIGASGAIAGIVVLYALNFPRRTVLFFFVLPMPAWFLGVFLVAMDLLGALGGGTPIAYSVHLAGAALAFLYFRFHWNFGTLASGQWWARRLRSQPALRVHYPQDDEPAQEVDLSQEVDRILEKIHRLGESSLTRQERRTLETASRQYQKRRKSQQH